MLGCLGTLVSSHVFGVCLVGKYEITSKEDCVKHKQDCYWFTMTKEGCYGRHGSNDRCERMTVPLACQPTTECVWKAAKGVCINNGKNENKNGLSIKKS